MNSRIPDPSKPVIAILTTSDRVKQFRGNRNNFRDIIRTGREMGFLVYVVTTRDLKLEERTVNGYVPSPAASCGTAFLSRCRRSFITGFPIVKKKKEHQSPAKLPSAWSMTISSSTTRVF